MALNRRRVHAPHGVHPPQAPHKRKRRSDADNDAEAAQPIIDAFRRKYSEPNDSDAADKRGRSTTFVLNDDGELSEVDEAAPTPIHTAFVSPVSTDSAVTAVSDTGGSLVIVEDSPDLKCHEQISDLDVSVTSSATFTNTSSASGWINVAKQAACQLVTPPPRRSKKSKRRSAVDDGPISKESEDKSIVTRRASSLRRIKLSTWQSLMPTGPPTLPSPPPSPSLSSETQAESSPYNEVPLIFLSQPLLCDVLSYCTVVELLHCRRVNRSFHTAATSKHSWKHSHLNIEDDKLLATVSNSETIRSSLSLLTKLSINGQQQCEVSDGILATLLPSMKSLQSLSLLNCPNVSDQCCQTVTSALSATLTSLTLQNCLSLTDRGLSLLTPLASHVTVLDLTKYRGLTTLNSLSSFINLTTLNLRGCRGINENSLVAIRNLPLVSLDLSFIPLTSQGLALLFSDSCSSSHSGEAELRDTLLSLTMIGSDSIDNACVYQLANCQSLEALNLSSCDSINDAAFTQWPLYGPGSLSLQSLTLDLCRRISGLTLRSIGEAVTVSHTTIAGGTASRIIGNGFNDEIHFDDDSDCEVESDSKAGDKSSNDSDDELLQRNSPTRSLAPVAVSVSGVVSVAPHPWQSLALLSVRHCHRVDSSSKTALSRVRPTLRIA